MRRIPKLTLNLFKDEREGPKVRLKSEKWRIFAWKKLQPRKVPQDLIWEGNKKILGCRGRRDLQNEWSNYPSPMSRSWAMRGQDFHMSTRSKNDKTRRPFYGYWTDPWDPQVYLPRQIKWALESSHGPLFNRIDFSNFWDKKFFCRGRGWGQVVWKIKKNFFSSKKSKILRKWFFRVLKAKIIRIWNILRKTFF